MSAPVYVLTVRAMRSKRETVPAIIRLRKALKALQRSYRLKVVRCEDLGRIGKVSLPAVSDRPPKEIQGHLF